MDEVRMSASVRGSGGAASTIGIVLTFDTTNTTASKGIRRITVPNRLLSREDQLVMLVAAE